MRKVFALCSLLAAAAVTSGCISTTMYGCEVVETLAPNSTEGEVIMKHGAPDNIVYLGSQYFNPQTGERGEVDKYLYEYRIGGGSTLLGELVAADEFHNICYLIEGGRVMGGGYVGEGKGSMLLGFRMAMSLPLIGTVELNPGGFLHPKARAGYGGDGSPDGGSDLTTYSGQR
jgi:hypothetical protein